MKLSQKQKKQLTIDAARAAGFIFKAIVSKHEVLYGCYHNAKEQCTIAWCPTVDFEQAIELARQMQFVIDFKNQTVSSTVDIGETKDKVEYRSSSFAKIDLKLAIVLLAAKIWNELNE